jgi:MFS family permease
MPVEEIVAKPLDVDVDVEADPKLEMSEESMAHRAKVEKSLKRKLDLRCSLFVLIYILSTSSPFTTTTTVTLTSADYLDRNNISAARLKGLQADLKLSNTDYSTCLSILYVGYILMQVPSNMIVNRISRPSIYIGCAMLLWGMISTLSGVVTSFGGMVATRFCLGFVEAAFLPGALLILSKVRVEPFRNSGHLCPCPNHIY